MIMKPAHPLHYMQRILRIVSFIWVSCTLNIPSAFADDIFKNLTVNDGLAHTDANCVTQDSTGLIWIGTNSGLQNFDGYRLRTIDYYSSSQIVYESHNRIRDIECGKKHLWVASESGLTCVDLKTHLYVPYTLAGNDSTLLNERILSLSVDNMNDRLWIRTLYYFYVARLEESTNTLHILEWINDDERKRPWSHSEPVLRENYTWMLADNQLIQLGVTDEKVGIVKNYDLHAITGVHADNLYVTDSHLYFRSSKGIYKVPFVKEALDFTHLSYQRFDEINAAIPPKTSGAFIVDREGALWCTYFGGVFKMEHPFTKEVTAQIYLGNNKNVNFSRSRISMLFIDNYNNLWVPTMNRGLYYCSLSPSPFHYIPRQKFQNLGFFHNEISAIAAQDDIALWAILEEGSLIRYDMQKKTVGLVPLTSTKGAEDGLQRLALSADRKRLYIGLSKGLIVYEPETGKDYRLRVEQPNTSGDFVANVGGMAEDRWGRLWVTGWGTGIYCIKDIQSNPSVEYALTSRTEPAIASDFTLDICMASDGILLATTQGLNKIWMNDQGEVRKVSTYHTDKRSTRSISSDYIACIDRQNDSIYWLGTIGGGLNRITIHSEADNDYSAVAYTRNDGLPSNDCEIVYLDHKQNVWVGGNGITCFFPAVKKAAVYGLIDGLQSNSYKIGAGCKGSDGTIYMGGIGGLNFFNPDSLTNNVSPPDLSFSDLYVNNRLIVPQAVYDGKMILPTILDEVGRIRLTHQQNNFMISFSALGYNLSNRIMYRYRMAGYDKEWQTVSFSTNKAFYSNLPYGDYRFEIQVSADRGVSWMKPGRSLAIVLSPPWWWTGWAKFSYVVLLILIIVLIGYQYNKEQVLKRENHIQELQRMNDEEKYQSKMRFFMNVSHELKTPLTLIMLAADRMAELNLSKECMTILSNARKMLSLITELVDIRKADLGINRLQLVHQSVSALVEQLYMEMKPWAEKKRLAMTYCPAEETVLMDFDRDKMGKLVVNLISNAIKYTPEGGSIELSLRKGMMKEVTPFYTVTHREGEVAPDLPVCILTIRDTGVGISPESIRYIYERFFQVKDTNLTHLGSGIGLAISKNMVLLHKGCIIVSSKRSVGTEFIVALPVTGETPAAEASAEFSSFNTKEFIDSMYLEYPISEEPEELEESKQRKMPERDTSDTDTELSTVLIVEDNKELRKALCEALEIFYNIKTADNGKTGLEMCKECYPDLIISDVMMPEMDGIEMCRQIRNNLSIAYIPIILLTAKGDMDSQIEGYESGADLYIPKPFSIRLLKATVKRLLLQRENESRILQSQKLPQEQLPEQLQEQLQLSKQDSPKEERDFSKLGTQAFVEQLNKIIDENMEDPDFSVDSLSQKIGMGRSTLYQKVKKITNLPLGEYIRQKRMDKAAYLLEHSELSVTEVMYAAGFINSSHFSKAFKIRYGLSPFHYKKRTSDNA